MYEIRTETLIDASVETVWDILADFSQYQDWNPFIYKIQAAPYEGARVRFNVKVGDFSLPLKTIINRFVPLQEIRWKGASAKQIGWLVDGEHYFILEKTGEHQTRFLHGEVFTGMLSDALAPVFNQARQDYLAMNTALKYKAEKQEKKELKHA